MVKNTGVGKTLVRSAWMQVVRAAQMSRTEARDRWLAMGDAAPGTAISLIREMLIPLVDAFTLRHPEFCSSLYPSGLPPQGTDEPLSDPVQLGFDRYRRLNIPWEAKKALIKLVDVLVEVTGAPRYQVLGWLNVARSTDHA